MSDIKDDFIDELNLYFGSDVAQQLYGDELANAISIVLDHRERTQQYPDLDARISNTNGIMLDAITEEEQMRLAMEISIEDSLVPPWRRGTRGLYANFNDAAFERRVENTRMRQPAVPPTRQPKATPLPAVQVKETHRGVPQSASRQTPPLHSDERSVSRKAVKRKGRPPTKATGLSSSDGARETGSLNASNNNNNARSLNASRNILAITNQVSKRPLNNHIKQPRNGIPSERREQDRLFVGRVARKSFRNEYEPAVCARRKSDIASNMQLRPTAALNTPTNAFRRPTRVNALKSRVTRISTDAGAEVLDTTSKSTVEQKGQILSTAHEHNVLNHAEINDQNCTRVNDIDEIDRQYQELLDAHNSETSQLIEPGDKSSDYEKISHLIDEVEPPASNYVTFKVTIHGKSFQQKICRNLSGLYVLSWVSKLLDMDNVLETHDLYYLKGSKSHPIEHDKTLEEMGIGATCMLTLTERG